MQPSLFCYFEQPVGRRRKTTNVPRKVGIRFGKKLSKNALLTLIFWCKFLQKHPPHVSAKIQWKVHYCANLRDVLWAKIGLATGNRRCVGVPLGFQAVLAEGDSRQFVAHIGPTMTLVPFLLVSSSTLVPTNHFRGGLKKCCWSFGFCPNEGGRALPKFFVTFS